MDSKPNPEGTDSVLYATPKHRVSRSYSQTLLNNSCFNDDIITQSPKKFIAAMDDIEIPTLDGFQQEINNRPHEFEQDSEFDRSDSEETHALSPIYKYYGHQGNKKLNFKKDDSEESSEESDCERTCINKITEAYISITDELNTVQLLPDFNELEDTLVPVINDTSELICVNPQTSGEADELASHAKNYPNEDVKTECPSENNDEIKLVKVTANYISHKKERVVIKSLPKATLKTSPSVTTTSTISKAVSASTIKQESVSSGKSTNITTTKRTCDTCGASLKNTVEKRTTCNRGATPTKKSPSKITKPSLRPGKGIATPHKSHSSDAVTVTSKRPAPKTLTKSNISIGGVSAVPAATKRAISSQKQNVVSSAPTTIAKSKQTSNTAKVKKIKIVQAPSTKVTQRAGTTIKITCSTATKNPDNPSSALRKAHGHQLEKKI